MASLPATGSVLYGLGECHTDERDNVQICVQACLAPYRSSGRAKGAFFIEEMRYGDRPR